MLPASDDRSTLTAVTGFFGDALDDETVIAVLIRSTFGFQKGYLEELTGLTFVQILLIYFADVNVASNHVMCVVFTNPAIAQVQIYNKHLRSGMSPVHTRRLVALRLR